MNAELIDRIYESCFVPEVWPEVLDKLGRTGDTAGASLFVFKNEAQLCVASPEPRERAELLVKKVGCGVDRLSRGCSRSVTPGS